MLLLYKNIEFIQVFILNSSEINFHPYY